MEPVWAVGMERVPSIQFKGDQIVVENFRNFRYQCGFSHQEFYETRSINVPDLVSADFIVVPFSSQPDLAHTMMSFGTKDDQHVVVSVEARRRMGQKYGIIKGLFGMFPLVYVIADERDAIGQRIECRGDDVFIYRSSGTPDQVQEFFRCVMNRADKLSRSPERYNTVTNNCLTNIRYHLNKVAPGSVPWNWRLLVNRHSDYLAYSLGLLASSDTFESTREEANVSDRAAGNWHREDFSELIRA